MSRVLIIVIALILYGSLYPWEWQAEKIDNPLLTLRDSLRPRLDRYLLRDVFVNLVLYVPLGVCAFLARRPSLRIGARVASALLIGVCLSILVELLQLPSRTRFPSVIDVISNALGTGLGVSIALVFQQRLAPLVHRSKSFRTHDRTAVGLLACWYAMLLSPFFPVLLRSQLVPKLGRFFELPLTSFVPFASAFVCWLTAGYLFHASGLKRPWRYLLATTLLIPFQVFIVNREPRWIEFVGAALGCAVFALLPGKPKLAAWSFFVLLFLRGFSPFVFHNYQNRFGWVPFGGFLAMEWHDGVFVVIEKFFYYGAAIWILHYAGMRLRLATISVAAALAVIEIVQIYQPRRTPEVTDPVLAILLGVVLDSLKQSNSVKRPVVAKVN